MLCSKVRPRGFVNLQDYRKASTLATNKHSRSLLLNHATIATVCSSMSTNKADTATKVALITTLGCPYCQKAKSVLKAAEIDFEIFDLTEQPDLLSSIKEQTGQVTVPQVFVGGKLLGGASELVEAIDNGSFQQLLQTATPPALPETIAAAVSNINAATAASPQHTSNNPNNNEELQAISNAMKNSSLTQANTSHTFSLQAAITYLTTTTTNTATSEPDAVIMLSHLQAAQLITIISPSTTTDIPINKDLVQRAGTSTLLVFVQDISLPDKLHQPLNTHFRWFGDARPATIVAADLRKLMLQLFSEHLTEDGRLVDYKAMVKDAAFRKYVDTAAELQKVDVYKLTREEALCFWINIYNALILHATAAIGPATSTLSRLSWFDNISYEINGSRFTSNHIEHGVLRGNAPSPASFFSLLGKPSWAGRTFKRSDDRCKLAIKPVDPRIHFALNCGALSCPPIKVYTPERLEAGLSAAAQGFCSSEVDVDEGEMKLKNVSMIFKWYGGDFGDKEALLRFIAAHQTDTGKKEALERMLKKAGPGADGIELEYKLYDWGTNAKE